MRTEPLYPRDQIRALVAYVGTLGGPSIPRPRPSRGNLRDGFRLFTENCAGCHQIVGEGGNVGGSRAPPLDDATPVQIAEAVRVGPYVMPRFTREQLDERELDSIIRYVRLTNDPDDRGGWGIGHIGPIPEGIVTWLLAATLLVGVAVVIGKRAD